MINCFGLSFLWRLNAVIIHLNILVDTWCVTKSTSKTIIHNYWCNSITLCFLPLGWLRLVEEVSQIWIALRNCQLTGIHHMKSEFHYISIYLYLDCAALGLHCFCTAMPWPALTLQFNASHPIFSIDNGCIGQKIRSSHTTTKKKQIFKPQLFSTQFYIHIWTIGLLEKTHFRVSF